MKSAIEKRGGMRRPIRRKKTNAATASQTELFLDHRDAKREIFTKRLNDYRILICTDLETDDEAALAMLTGWVKTNEKYWDSRSQFPIYGMVVGETTNTKVKAQRAREFLEHFAELMCWNDPEHHLYNSYQSARKRIWFDDPSNRSYPAEKELIAGNLDTVAEPKTFAVGIEELMKTKADNLFIVYLKPLRFFKSLETRPEVFDYLRRVPGAIYGSWNIRCVRNDYPELTGSLDSFLNRRGTDAPLLFVESYPVLGEDNTMTRDICPKLFKALDESAETAESTESEESSLAARIRKSMYSWNDNLLNRHSATLQEFEQFKKVDFDDYESFKSACEQFTAPNAQIKKILKVVDAILKNGGDEFVLADPLVVVAMLIANGTLKTNLLKLQSVKVDYATEYFTTKPDKESKTWALLATDNSEPIAIKRLVERLLLKSFLN
jgi:hypothetical protein